jgi:hypothetical protein
MEAAKTAESRATRSLTCARCGAAFGCNLGGDCWCADESFRLPLRADDAADCLCPDCLRAMATATAKG